MVSGREVEEQFVQYLRTQHPNHLAAVFEALKPELMKAARRAGLDEQGAEDVVQETFLGVIKAQDRFESGKPFVPWVRGIAVRQINAERRRRARLRALFRPADARPEEGDLDASHLDPGELRTQIQAGLRTLSERNRQVVHAALFDGLSIDELSERFKLTKSATSVRLHRGLNQLRDRLGRQSNLGLLGAIPAWWRTPGQLLRRRVGRAEPLSVKAVVGIGATAMLALVGVRLALIQQSEPDQVDAVHHNDVAVRERIESNGEPSDRDVSTGERSVVDTGAELSSETVDGTPEENPTLAKVTGVVVQSNGAPAPAGVEVFVLQTTPDLVLPTAPLVPLATTDAEGRYVLASTALSDDPTPLLMVRYDDQVGWVDVRAEDIAGGALPSIELMPEIRLDVNVTDVNGLPLEGAAIAGLTRFPRFMAPIDELSRQFGFLVITPYQHLFGATSDDRGKGSIRGLFGVKGESIVYFLIVSKDGYASSMQAYDVPEDTLIQTDVVLLSLDSLSFAGKVVNQDGAPLPGAELRFVVRGESPIDDTVLASTTASANWSVPSELLGEYPFVVRFECPGYSSAELAIDWPEDLSNQPYTVTLAKETPLEVLVRDEHGRPLPGTELIVATVGGIQSAVTGEDGSFKFRGLRRGNRRITARHGPGGNSQRFIAQSVAAGTNEVSLVLPEPTYRVTELTITNEDQSDWKFATLLASEVEGFEGWLAPAQLTRGAANFDEVPVGVWVFSGMTMEGDPCIERLQLTRDSHGESVSVEVSQAATGQADCVISTAKLPASGLKDCLVVMRRTDLPGLPGWLQTGHRAVWTELYRPGDPNSLLHMDELAVGQWSLVAMGEGWASAPITFEVNANQVARIDVEPSPAGVASFVRPSGVNPGIARVETRRGPADSWQLAGLLPFAYDLPEPSVVPLPEGDWQWRATLQFLGEDGQYRHSYPPTYGILSVAAGSNTMIDIQAASITPPE